MSSDKYKTAKVSPRPPADSVDSTAWASDNNSAALQVRLVSSDTQDEEEQQQGQELEQQEQQQQQGQQQQQQKKKWWNVCAWERKSQVKLGVIVLVLAVVIVAIAVFRINSAFIDLLEWLDERKTLGALIFIAIYAVATVCLIPASILTLGAGFVFKPLPFAVALVLCGASIGLMAAFLLGRYVFREAVAAKAAQNPKWQAIDKAIKLQGWKICFLLRLAPIVPFNLLNYSLSLSDMDFGHYSASSIVGMIPGTIMFCYFGSLASDLSDIASGNAGPNPTERIALTAGSGVLIITVVVLVTRYAKRAIRRALDEVDMNDLDQERRGASPADDNGE